MKKKRKISKEAIQKKILERDERRVHTDLHQLEKWGNPNSHSMATWAKILGKEVNELADAITEYIQGVGSLKQIAHEATQVATVAIKIAWMCRRKLKKARGE